MTKILEIKDFRKVKASFKVWKELICKENDDEKLLKAEVLKAILNQMVQLK